MCQHLHWNRRELRLRNCLFAAVHVDARLHIQLNINLKSVFNNEICIVFRLSLSRITCRVILAYLCGRWIKEDCYWYMLLSAAVHWRCITLPHELSLMILLQDKLMLCCSKSFVAFLILLQEITVNYQMFSWWSNFVLPQSHWSLWLQKIHQSAPLSVELVIPVCPRSRFVIWMWIPYIFNTVTIVFLSKLLWE